MDQGPSLSSQVRPPSWQILLAFSIIYFVWGSTFLAIRIGVREVPPFLLAAFRFLAAGSLLYGWSRSRGNANPTSREWVALLLPAFLIFVLDYGSLFWAEQRVPSGIAAVLLATIPLFICLSEIVFLGARRFTFRLGFAFLLGILGVAVLVNPSASFGGQSIDKRGVIVLMLAAVSWSVATALNRKLPLPSSKPMSAAAQMLAGGVFLLILAAVTGEMQRFHFAVVSWGAWFALGYLVVPGSIMGFTAYLWLLHYESPTRVGTYAYVNPVVAVILGYLLGGEALGLRTILATVLILISVLVIATAAGQKTIASGKQPAPRVSSTIGS